MKLSGVIPPMLTPAADDGMQVDHDRLRRFTGWLLDAGVNGLFIGASAGESAMLDRSQRRAALETVIAETQGRVPIIAGVSAPSTAQSLQYARDAEAAGADYLISLPPGVFPLSEDEMVHHYATLSDSVDIPTLLYNFPELTGGKIITPKIAATLSQKHRVVGIKDTSGSVVNSRTYRRACGDEFMLLVGSDPNIYAYLALGADGMICSGSNIAPKTYVALYQAFRSGDHAKAIALQDAILPFIDITRIGSFPSSVKACLSSLGIPAGPPFLPVFPASDAQAAAALEFFGNMQAASRDLGVA